MYFRALFNDWLTGMCGTLSVPFAAIAVFWAHASRAKLLWGCFAIVAFVIAGYRVWRNERTVRIKDFEELRQKMSAEIDDLNSQIVILKRKPYEEELGIQAAELIGRLSAEGRILLRHLVEREPLEVGSRFRPNIAQAIQDAQLAIAFGSGIVRHNQVWLQNGHLLRTDFVVAPQFRAVLEDLLYEEDGRYLNTLGQF